MRMCNHCRGKIPTYLTEVISENVCRCQATVATPSPEQKENAEMKPYCPDCGSRFISYDVLASNPAQYRPVCRHCGCSGGICKTKEEAVEFWTPKATPAIPVAGNAATADKPEAGKMAEDNAKEILGFVNSLNDLNNQLSTANAALQKANKRIEELEEANRFLRGQLDIYHEDDKKAVQWRRAAQLLGERIGRTGPYNYYSITPEEWLEWIKGEIQAVQSGSSRALIEEHERKTEALIQIERPIISENGKVLTYEEELRIKEKIARAALNPQKKDL